MARDDDGFVCRFFQLAGAAVVVLALLVILLFITYKPPLYYASVNSVSGVGDVDRGLHFLLTLAVKSRSPLWRHPCIDRGTVVEVGHHGVVLVYGALSCETCAPPLWDRSTTVVSMERSNVSGLPEFVVESMAADARRGVQVFDVTMQIPSTGQDGHGGKLVSCMARLVGGNTFANACDVHYS